ncbi:MAG: alpha/beta hydrolase [Phycisphaeraceae bacterium]|nr:alpha/beta hydrolase [Phycisphaeraceae bacterium]
MALPDGARVEGWFLPGLGRDAANPGPLVIYAHGNAELIEQNLGRARMYQDLGISVLMPEYRGYGRSGGSPGEAEIVADFGRFAEWAAGQPEVDPRQVVYHGRSLGGGVTAQLAARRPPFAMILESSFTSVTSMAWSFGVPPFLVRNTYRTDLVLPGLNRPLLIIHGTDDDIIPVVHGRRLHELAPGSTLVELAGTHNDFPQDERAYRAAIRMFLDEHGLVPANAPAP